MESTLEVGWCTKVIRWLARLEGGQGLGMALALPAACLGAWWGGGFVWCLQGYHCPPWGSSSHSFLCCHSLGTTRDSLAQTSPGARWLS